MRFRGIENVVRSSACVFALVASPSWAGPIEIFSDGFESRNTLAWSTEQPPLAAPAVHRLTDLDLRDPHFYVEFIACFDITDNDLPGAPGSAVNTRFAAAIASDDDGDGFLDSSSLLAFRPYDPLATAERIDLGYGDCPEPSPPVSCDWRRPPVPQTSDYEAFGLGTCLEPVVGTTFGYSPSIVLPVDSCAVSSPTTLYLSLLGAEIPVLAAQVAADRFGEPPTELRDGLWMELSARERRRRDPASAHDPDRRRTANLDPLPGRRGQLRRSRRPGRRPGRRERLVALLQLHRRGGELHREVGAVSPPRVPARFGTPLRPSLLPAGRREMLVSASCAFRSRSH